MLVSLFQKYLKKLNLQTLLLLILNVFDLKPFWFEFEYLNQIPDFHIWKVPKSELSLFYFEIQFKICLKIFKPFLFEF
jgi:hypothetical protein